MSKKTIRDAGPGDIGRITEIYAHAVLNGTATYELEPPSPAEMLARFEALKAEEFPYLVAVDESGRVLVHVDGYETVPLPTAVPDDVVAPLADAFGGAAVRA